MTNNIIGILVSYIYAGGLLLFAEGLRKFFGVPPEFTRKIIHISAGMWVFGILFLFDDWRIGILPFVTFIFVNYLLYRYRVIAAMDTGESSPGTVYFAISVSLLFALFWRPGSGMDNAPIAVAGVMAMTWGDAFAALIGKRFGKYKYTVFSSTRTYEGSLVMFLASSLAIFLVLLLLPGSVFSPLASPLDFQLVVITTVIAAAFATLVEAISPRGTDNFSVPLVTSVIVWLSIIVGAVAR